MAAGTAAGTAKPATHTVAIDGATFAPPKLTVTAGDTVVWVNKDPYPHTATSKEGGFDSKELGEGKSFRFVAKKKGDFPYVCTLHPTMKGTITVK